MSSSNICRGSRAQNAVFVVQYEKLRYCGCKSEDIGRSWIFIQDLDLHTDPDFTDPDYSAGLSHHSGSDGHIISGGFFL